MVSDYVPEVQVVEFQLNRHYLVLAKSYARFVHWCRENELDREQLNVKYISLPTQLLAYSGTDVTVVTLSSWWVDRSPIYYEQMCEYMKRLEDRGAEVVHESI